MHLALAKAFKIWIGLNDSLSIPADNSTAPPVTSVGKSNYQPSDLSLKSPQTDQSYRKREAPSRQEGQSPNYSQVTHDLLVLNELPERQVTPTVGRSERN